MCLLIDLKGIFLLKFIFKVKRKLEFVFFYIILCVVYRRYVELLVKKLRFFFILKLNMV